MATLLLVVVGEKYMWQYGISCIGMFFPSVFGLLNLTTYPLRQSVNSSGDPKNKRDKYDLRLAYHGLTLYPNDNDFKNSSVYSIFPSSS